MMKLSYTLFSFTLAVALLLSCNQQDLDGKANMKNNANNVIKPTKPKNNNQQLKNKLNNSNDPKMNIPTGQPSNYQDDTTTGYNLVLPN